MQLDRLSVRLRPRGGWEALDLGFLMARSWWRPVWGTWLAVFVPAAVLLHAVFWRYPWVAMAVTWWLKPAFDRFVLHVVSQAVFGDPPGVRASLAAWRRILSPGVAGSLLTWHRFGAARSFTMPVSQLERQSGAAGRARRAALGRRSRGTAVWLTVACSSFELFVLLSLGVGVHLLAPGTADPSPEFASLFGGREEEGAWSLVDSLTWCLAICAIEPFYVAAGFSLYLNRRAILEGWDIELQLRRLDERLAKAAPAAAVLLAVALAAAWPAPAAAAERNAKQEIAEVLKAPELDPYRDELRWRLRRDDAPEAPKPGGPQFGALGKLFADILQALAWVAAAVVGALALWQLARFVRLRLADAEADAWRPPEVLFGLAVAPASLPDDVAGAAAALAREGRVRDALSLLYRGALSVLVHRERVRLAEGDTEGDALRAARRVLAGGAAEYFGALVRAWIDAAYAGRVPDARSAEGLALGWAAHFAARREEPRA